MDNQQKHVKQKPRLRRVLLVLYATVLLGIVILLFNLSDVLCTIHPWLSSPKPDTAYHDGLRAQRILWKIGYVDQSEYFVIPPIFKEAYEFSEGLAAVMDYESWGYIDKTGEVVIPMKYTSCTSFFEGKADVQCGERCYSIDKTGKIVAKRPELEESFKPKQKVTW